VPAAHRGAEAGGVAGAEGLRDDQGERLPDRLLSAGASWAVSSRMVSTVRVRAVSPVAASQFWWPIAVAAATGVTHYFVGAIPAHLRG
jgi:hypothetical protein